MLEKISITNYRNIEKLVQEIDQFGNVLIAPNSSGKTNFLESIYYSIFRKSFKTIQNNVEVIGPANEFSKVSMVWEGNNIETVVSKLTTGISRKFTLDQKRFSLPKVISKFPIVLFAPNSVDLVSGEPGIRRSDLDDYLSMIDVAYKLHIDRYSQLLKNRNALIKTIREGKSSAKELSFWTDELVKSANEIYKLRSNFFYIIKTSVKESVHLMEVFLENDLFETLTLAYEPNIQSSVENFSHVLKSKYEQNQEKEIAAGKTLYGIHKDDYSIFLGDKNMRFFGSRGQQRLATFLIKYAQLNFFKEKFSYWPIFLIDDLMSELDRNNRLKVGNFLTKQDFQFILTSAEEFEVPESLMTTSKILSL